MAQVEVRFYPTTVRLPAWVRPLAIQGALARLRISEPEVKLLDPEFRLTGLARSPYKPEYDLALDSSAILRRVSAEVAIDGVEVVEWMRISAAENTVMQARINEYNRLGSQLVGQSGDGYIPGVIVEDLKYVSQTGATVRSQGFATVATPRGNFNIPSLGKNPGIFRDLLSWGSMSYVGAVQFTGSLLKWKSLAETPITQAVGFYMDAVGNTAPNFFVQRPPRPALSVTVRQTISSDDKQTLKINFRDPTNYSNTVGTKSVAIAKGTNQVTFTVSAFPYVPPLIAEIQPEDKRQTKLEAYTVG